MRFGIWCDGECIAEFEYKDDRDFCMKLLQQDFYKDCKLLSEKEGDDEI